MGKLEKADLELTTFMRRLWLRMNECIFEEMFQSPIRVIKPAKDGLQEFQSVQLSLRGTSSIAQIGGDSAEVEKTI